MKKIKCWVVVSEEYPNGAVYKNREDALDDSYELRINGVKAYTRIKHFTQKELDEMPELD